MEYALFRKAAQQGQGWYQQHDCFGDCVRGFIRPENAYSASVQMLVPPKILSSWYVINSHNPLLYTDNAPKKNHAINLYALAVQLPSARHAAKCFVLSLTHRA